MMYKAYAAFLMCLGVALTIASNQAFGGARVVHGGVSASPHSTTFHRSFARLHHRGRHRRDFFPGSFFWGPYDQPNLDIPPPISGPASNDVTYTYKMDIPWDWAHRFLTGGLCARLRQAGRDGPRGRRQGPNRNRDPLLKESGRWPL